MKFAKRLSASLLAIVLISMLFMIPGAATGAIIRGGCTQSKPGTSLTYTVSVEGNPGIAAFVINIRSELDGLKLKQDSDGEYMVKRGTFSDSGTVFANADDTGGWNVLWFNIEDCTDDGSLFELEFDVPDDISAGEYPVSLSYSAVDTVNVSGEKIDFAVEDGSITILPEETTPESGVNQQDETETSPIPQEQITSEPDGQSETRQEAGQIDLTIAVIAGFIILIITASIVLKVRRKKDDGGAG